MTHHGFPAPCVVLLLLPLWLLGCREAPNPEGSQFIEYGRSRGAPLADFNAVALEDSGAFGVAGASVEVGGDREGLTCDGVMNTPTIIPLDPGDPGLGSPPGSALADSSVAAHAWVACTGVDPSAAGVGALGACNAGYLIEEGPGEEVLFTLDSVVDGGLEVTPEGEWRGWLEGTGDETLFVGGVEDSIDAGVSRYLEFAATLCEG